MTKEEQLVFSLFLPDGVLEWFDVVEGRRDENNIYLTLKEKNLPPVSNQDKDKKVVARGFTDITITDFPIRGRRTLITFKRRYWQVEGREGYLKRDIKLSFPGTQLEQEFARFLKEDGGRKSGLAQFYCRVSADPNQRI